MKFLIFLYYTTFKGISHFVLYYLDANTIKTVSRAEVATIVAYMLGVPDEILNEYYSHHYSKLLETLKNNKDANIIRYLSKIRTELFKHFRDVDNEIVYNLSNLDRMSFFDK